MSDDGSSKSVHVLSKEETERVTKFINEKAADPEDRCAVCGDPQNIVTKTTYSILARPIGGRHPMQSKEEIPCYATVCLNCGFVRFFSKHILDQDDVDGDGNG